MMQNPSFNLDNFDNTDPRIVTVLVIGTEENVKAHILRQHTLGVAEAGLWSKLLPVPNCRGKVMSILNRILM
jgi:hypothetical protein